MNKILLRKIRLAFGFSWSESKIARYFGLSRYRVMYMLGKLKRSPTALKQAQERDIYLSEKEWEELGEERQKQAREDKENYEKLIMRGNFNEDYLVRNGQEFRRRFYLVHDIYPENVK